MEVNFSAIGCSGVGTCVGGSGPDPPIDGYPLLAWSDGEVRTEDGRATVAEIDRSSDGTSTLEQVAARFGTTAAHVSQAINYAREAVLTKGH